ncbi:uncharacterized protein LOC111265710 [Varroa jacobsoni]|uniref:uncharacterized protein LOC111265710 n=1 Tax=Varroa jacobsoni TaxID=62625 RepID=UPI000BF94178|nr:uncharacterized protein LOC111265710 [Varroa jacobsoni]
MSSLILRARKGNGRNLSTMSVKGSILVLVFSCMLCPNQASLQPKPVSESGVQRSLAKPNIEIMHFVLDGIRDSTGKSSKSRDVSTVEEEGVRGRSRGTTRDSVLLFQDGPNPLSTNNQNDLASLAGCRTGLIPSNSAFPRGGGYRRGGYRGQKVLLITSGGYRGVPAPVPFSKNQIPPNVSHHPHGENSQVKDIPFDQLVAFPGLQHLPRPDRKFQFSGLWKPEVVVDLPQVIREDRASGDGNKNFLGKPLIPAEGPVHSSNSNHNRPPRPPLVTGTADRPTKKDYISQLEAELLSGLSPQQLEELSHQAINPRHTGKRDLKIKRIFPGLIV